jgi:hypothetical protein
MRIQDANARSGSERTAIDRHAVTAAGHLLMSAIWLEHRVRRFSTRVTALPSKRATGTPAVSSSVAHGTDEGLPLPGSQGD